MTDLHESFEAAKKAEDEKNEEGLARELAQLKPCRACTLSLCMCGRAPFEAEHL